MRIVGHLDMDAFFAAAEERENPKLKGLPIVVGADPKGGKGRGVVSTANYKAREYGIHSAMPISRAWQLGERARKAGKPKTVFLPVYFPLYEKISRNVFDVLGKYAGTVEPAGIDEFYFDLSGAGSFREAEVIAGRIKNEIREKERLTASIGIAGNKLVAKIASDYRKPDGLTVVREPEKFLAPLPIRKIPGIGPKTEAFFKAKGINYVKDLKRFSASDLRSMLGKWGDDLYCKVRGIDESPVSEKHEIKSVGEQETFSRDTLNAKFIFERLDKMAHGVFESVRKQGFTGFRTVVLTVRFADFETKSRAHTLKKKTGSRAILKLESIRLILPFLDSRENPRHKPIRLIGLRVEKLVHSSIMVPDNGKV